MKTSRQRGLMKKIMLTTLLILLYSCNITDNNGKDVKVYSRLNKNFEDTLRIVHNPGAITRMELEITGNIKGKGKLAYSHPPFIIEHFVDLQGSIKKTITTDWYDESCLIKYEPEDSLVSGEITIKYVVY